VHWSAEAMSLSGVVFLDKPCGWTSRRAVNEVVQCLRAQGAGRLKAGHAGTLDPLASGMLPVLLGEATRFAEHGLSAEKCYRVELDLSFQTDTLDMEGMVVSRHAPCRLERSRLEALLQGFVGVQEQIPPSYSAVRVQGKRAHALARAGEQPVLPARRITIHALVLEQVEGMRVRLRVRCSKGTYIRALARDIGQRLGLGGCVVALRRLASGGWGEEVMVTMEQLRRRGPACVVPLTQWLRDLPVCQLTAEMARRFVQGQRLQLERSGQGEVAVYAGALLLGTGMLRPGQRRFVLHPGKVLPSARQALLET